MIASNQIAFGRGKSDEYIAGYTNLIESRIPVGTGDQIIALENPIVPLSDFTVDGCMTYTGTSTGDSSILGINLGNSEAFSIWYRDGNAVPRCFAMEGRGSPIATNILENPTFSFSMRFDKSKLTMAFSNGDLSSLWTISSTNWAWKTAYNTISNGLKQFLMNSERLSTINRIHVYPRILSDKELLTNNRLDKARFDLS